MARFYISRIAINDHHPMYADLIDSLVASLAALGHQCMTGINQFDPDATNVLVGSTIFAARELKLGEALQGKSYIVYQLEQLDEAHGLLRDWPEYTALLAGAAWIWDYAPSSTAFLRARGFPRVAYLPPGFHPCLDTFRPAAEPQWDVIFPGSQHPRRTRILEALQAQGCKVAQMFGSYGATRNAVLGDCRIVINIHAWDDLDVLETIRLSHLLANHCFVVSETSDHNPYADGVVYADYTALVQTCLDYLKQPESVREAVARRGAAAVRQHDMVGLVQKVLAETLNLS